MIGLKITKPNNMRPKPNHPPTSSVTNVRQSLNLSFASHLHRLTPRNSQNYHKLISYTWRPHVHFLILNHHIYMSDKNVSAFFYNETCTINLDDHKSIPCKLSERRLVQPPGIFDFEVAFHDQSNYDSSIEYLEEVKPNDQGALFVP